VRGQALVEFAIVLPLLSLIFISILYFGLAGIGSLRAEMEARNAAFRQQGAREAGLFRKYANETPEMARFLVNYEQKINPAGLDFRQIRSSAECTLSRSAFPALARGFRYRTWFAMDCLGSGGNAEMKEKAVEVLSEDLFGLRDQEGNGR
jgi:hypothetical protein